MRLISLAALLLINYIGYAQLNITYTVNTTTGRTSISPYIYGNNLCESWYSNRAENVTARRASGNRFTGFNWEHGYSNAGSDWGPNQTDTYLYSLIGISVPSPMVPGRIIQAFHDTSLVTKAYSLITIPAAGYVAQGTTKLVTTNAPSASNWDAIQHTKGSAFTLTPSTSDGVVYTDEMLNWITNRYGLSTTTNGIKGYTIDNEPDLWNSTHPRIHGTAVGCQELVDKTVTVSRVVKTMDPGAEVFGFVSYGYEGLRRLQSAPDWSGAGWSGTYPWYVDGFLDKLKVQSTADGKRLLDVLDFHWYPEHQGADNGGTLRRVYDGNPQTWDSHNGVRTARMQAPRSLWDPSFIENSWIISAYGSTAIQIIPTLMGKIATRYPGTKLSISEYDFGAEDDISGGIATVDAMGIFGKQGIYMANYWGDIKNYVSSAFKLYRNYDGLKSTYENTNVTASSSDMVNSPVYASVNNTTDKILHIVLTNKHLTNTINGTFNITSGANFTTAKVYGFKNGTTALSLYTTIAVSGNSFTYTVPALSAIHIVLTDPTGLPVEILTFQGQRNSDNEVSLNWTVAQEKDLKGYAVEKSDNGTDWNTIGFINAENKTAYSFTDVSANSSAYYRLKNINTDLNTDSYSKVISIEGNNEKISYSLYPNPFSNSVHLQYAGKNKLMVIIRDMTGKIMHSSECLANQSLELGENLPDGFYIIEIKDLDKQKSDIIKLVKAP
jgi:mannan endo-1,4-beta-mannosidase